jgi:NADH-ubiquinone oxidoreductase chain 4
MLNTLLLIIPLIGIISILTNAFSNVDDRVVALITSIVNFVISLFMFIIFDFSNIDYQFVQEVYEFNGLNIYLGLDGISIYFVLLTTFITPVVLVSN